MKNIIISGLTTYIYAGLCEVKNMVAIIAVFFLVWFVCMCFDERGAESD